MGYTFQKSRGRSWELRKRSMELWPDWIQELNTLTNPISIKTPLIKIAKSEKEAVNMKNISEEKSQFHVEFIKPYSKKFSSIDIKYGGLISHNEGRVDPISLQKSILAKIEKYNIKKIGISVSEIKRQSNNKENKWHIILKNEEVITQNTIIICSSIGSNSLLNSLGHKQSIEPILGQVLDLELKNANENWSDWPAVLNMENINLIPYGKNKILIGATLENGIHPNNIDLVKMKSLNNKGPAWLTSASIKNKWYGLRGRPNKSPAPLLEILEPGLILASGHYRNGVLLAPATAEWVTQAIKN